MKFLVLIVLCISIHFISSFEFEDDFDIEDETSPCAGRHANSTLVLQFCDSFGGTILHRCCRSYDNKTFVAIDLMDANLTEFPDLGYFKASFDLAVIDLRANDDLVSLSNDDFLNFTSLNDLLLPEGLKCPGGERIWETITNRTDPLGIHCHGQKSICANLTDLCTEQGSICTANGPTFYLCLCKPGYHGYKCLRYGNFPSGIFYGLTVVVTVITSIFLYWTQRRHAKK